MSSPKSSRVKYHEKSKTIKEGLETVEAVKGKLEAGEYVVRPHSSKSTVWATFSKIFSKDNRDTNYVYCNVCKCVKSYIGYEGTSNLKRHRCVIVADSDESSNKKKVVIPDNLKKSVTDGAVQMCCSDLRPFELVSRQGFTQFVSTLLQVGATLGATKAANVDVNELLPHPTTISRNTGKLHQKELTKLIEKISSFIKEGSLAATTDLWTEMHRQRCFLTVTVHFIDDEWSLHRRTLFTREFPTFDENKTEIRKTGINVLAMMEVEFERCQITREQMQRIEFVTDQGPNIKKALEGCQRSNCCAHIFNNIAQEAFSKYLKETCELLNKCFQNCKSLVEYFKRSGLNASLSSTLKQSCTTRWNTVVIMFRSIVLVYGEIQSALQGKRQEQRLNDIKVAILEGLIDLLTPFETATDILQRDTVPTSCCVILEITRLKTKLKSSIDKFSIDYDEEEESYSNELMLLGKKLLELVEEKFVYTQWQKGALYLWPKYRQLKCLPAGEKEQVIQNLATECYALLSSDDNLFATNADADASSSSSITPVSTNSSIQSSQQAEEEEEVDEWADVPEPSQDLNNVEDELERYSKAVYQNEPVLEWWRENAKNYPLLSRVAKRLLAIPASSAPSERVFSIAGRALEERRVNLEDENVDAILFIHSLCNDQ